MDRLVRFLVSCIILHLTGWNLPFSCQLHYTAFDGLKSHTPLPGPAFLSIPPEVSRLMTKPAKWHERPAKTQSAQRRLRSESSLSARRKLGSLATHWAHSWSESSLGAHSLCGFVMSRLKYQCVLFCHWFHDDKHSYQQTSYSRLNVCRDIVYAQRDQK